MKYVLIVLSAKQELLQFVMEHIEDKNVEALLEVSEDFPRIDY